MPERPQIAPRILVTTDFSDDSQRAFYHALAITVSRRGRLTLLHTGPESRNEVPWDQFPGVRETLTTWGLLAPDASREAVQESVGIGVAKMAMRDDDPRQGITDYLNRHPTDLLVMATKGRSGVARLFHASVAETVAYQTRSHSLLLPDKATGFVDSETGVATVQRVVCVLDPYQDPRAGFAFLRAWLPAFGGELAEVLVIDCGEAGYFEERQLPRGDGQTWTLRRDKGPVADVAVEAAETHDPDLVVMSIQGRLGLRARLAGSNAERILREHHLPLLLMPSG